MLRPIHVSLISANFLQLQELKNTIESCDFLGLHCDVMDGVFVPNVTFGTCVLQWFQNIDIHLMVAKPLFYLELFQDLSIRSCSLHVENLPSLESLEQYKKKYSLGLVFDLYTDPKTISKEILEYFDYYLVMSVKAGFGGQLYQDVSQKIQYLLSFQKPIQIDGGITDQLLGLEGVNSFVMGSWFFKESLEKQREILQEKIIKISKK
jgi:ribulose-phosphate 3-epimerase